MKDRAEVEQAIRDEAALVEAVAGLIKRRSALSAWPDGLRAVLAAALADDARSRAEGWKATALRRHLFGGDGSIPHGISGDREPTEADRRHAAPLRAALVARVRYRSGMHLIPSPR